MYMYMYMCANIRMKPSLHFCFQYGKLKEVRLVKNRAGKSKGFAYIEYLNEVYLFCRKSKIKVD